MAVQQARWDGRLILASALFSALAFNLVFFVQELMLTLPKAFVPGVHVRLYHNNHNWTGDAPILPLLQGTGGLTDLVMGLLFLVWLKSTGDRSVTTRLFLFWMAFQGFYEGLSQIVIGAMVPGNDMGMAFGYLGFSAGAKNALFVLGLILCVLAGVWLARAAVRLIATTSQSLTADGRIGFLLRTVLLPALIAGPLLIPYRFPRNMIEMFVFPAALMLFGAILVTLGGAFAPTSPQPARPAPSLVVPLVALIVVLLVFQLILRPGIAFS